ncbi:Chromate transporter [Synechococcus sp. RS9916]|nr:Chromate transporter [Synechococcus sp. RS9916]
MRRALLGINATVVGILMAALCQPVWQTGIRGGAEFSLALVAFVLLVSWRPPAWVVCPWPDSNLPLHGITPGKNRRLGHVGSAELLFTGLHRLLIFLGKFLHFLLKKL